MSRAPTIRYRCPAAGDDPFPGLILMGNGPRVRRAYRVLNARKTTSVVVGLGICTWKLTVEPMSAAAGREEIDADTPAWTIKWDSRKRRD